MQGAIANIDALERWFKGVGAPLFTLSYYSTQSPTGQGVVIMRNSKETNLDHAWALLKNTVVDQTGFGRAQLHLFTYDSEKTANNPSGRTHIDLATPSAAIAPAYTAGIGSLPGLTESDFEKRLDSEREKWEMKARIQSLEEATGDDFMTKVEKIGQLPVVQMLIAGFMAKQGIPVPAMPINGPIQPEDPRESGDNEDIETELDVLAEIAHANGVSLRELLQKTGKLAQEQPSMVNILISQ